MGKNNSNNSPTTSTDEQYAKQLESYLTGAKAKSSENAVTLAQIGVHCPKPPEIGESLTTFMENRTKFMVFKNHNGKKAAFLNSTQKSTEKPKIKKYKHNNNNNNNPYQSQQNGHPSRNINNKSHANNNKKMGLSMVNNNHNKNFNNVVTKQQRYSNSREFVGFDQVGTVLNPSTIQRGFDHLSQQQDGGKLQATFKDEIFTGKQTIKQEVHQRPDFDVIIVLDISGSMAGSKIELSKQAIRELYQEVLQNNDGISIVLFNNQAHVLLPLTLKQTLENKGGAGIDTHLHRIKTSGQTALYDGMYLGMETLAKRTRQEKQNVSAPLLVFITDGQNTCTGNRNAQTIKSIVRKPGDNGFGGLKFSNFHLNFVTIGFDANKDEAEDFCKDCHHMEHFHAPTTELLAETFRDVKKVVEKQLLNVTRRRLRATMEVDNIIVDAKTGQPISSSNGKAMRPNSSLTIQGRPRLLDNHKTPNNNNKKKNTGKKN